MSEVFDPEYLRAEGLLRATMSSLRGAAWVFELGGNTFLLRHYRRGGVVSRLLHDRYLWWSSGAYTRPAREWRLLGEMRAHGFAGAGARGVARSAHRAAVIYRADFITVLIRGCRDPCIGFLLERELPEEGWRRLGATLRRFPRLPGLAPGPERRGTSWSTKEGCFHLVDFDRGRLRRGEEVEGPQPLRRLRRFPREAARPRPGSALSGRALPFPAGRLPERTMRREAGPERSMKTSVVHVNLLTQDLTPCRVRPLACRPALMYRSRIPRPDDH